MVAPALAEQAVAGLVSVEQAVAPVLEVAVLAERVSVEQAAIEWALGARAAAEPVLVH